MAKIYRNGIEIGGTSGGSGGGGGVSIVIGTLTLSSSSWTAGTNEYTQTVVLSGHTISTDTKVDLQPSAAVLHQMATDGTTALFLDCTNNVVTAHAVGTAPTANLTVQYSITESITDGNEVEY